MSSLIIQDTTLQDIADAIRAKTGDNNTMTPIQMAQEINNIQVGSTAAPQGGFVFQNNSIVPSSVIEFLADNYFNDIHFGVPSSNMNSNYKGLLGKIDWSSKITSANDMAPQGRYNYDSLFEGSQFIRPPKFIFNFDTDYSRADGIVIRKMFYYCSNLIEVPNDFMTFPNGLNIQSGAVNQCYHNQVFMNCYNLISIPDNFMVAFTLVQDYQTKNQNSYVYQAFTACHVLNQVLGCSIPNVNGNTTMTSNAFNQTVKDCERLKRFTFITNNGNPYIANIINQRLDMTTVGYLATNGNTVVTPDSWPTENWPRDEYWITDQASYDLYKNNPRCVGCGVGWSRYNHDSMVETINSLPDTSAVSSPSNPSNQIIFAAGQGSLTDEGGPEALTQAEIQVATNKGWQVVI